jgi:hypothetical protein
VRDCGAASTILCRRFKCARIALGPEARLSGLTTRPRPRQLRFPSLIRGISHCPISGAPGNGFGRCRRVQSQRRKRLVSSRSQWRSTMSAASWTSLARLDKGTRLRSEESTVRSNLLPPRQREECGSPSCPHLNPRCCHTQSIPMCLNR